MSKSSARAAIRLHGVRHNNLKNFDLDLPLNQLIVITGLSGSGKSSLAFDTLFAEGQRRYIETFSPYARQFFDRMDKPQVDSIEGIPPAIAIEQRNSVKTTRSTVGTMTEICDYMKVLWPHLAQLHCRKCGRPVRKDAPGQIWESISREASAEVLITFDVPLSDKLSIDESLGLIAKQGYQRLLLNGKIVRLDELASRTPARPRAVDSLTVLQDRLKLGAANRARFVEACEQAYHFGKGLLTIHQFGREADGPQRNGLTRKFSNRFHCAECDIEYREPSPALFSFNHPVGACPTCKGFGRVISIDYELAIPDRSRTLAEGVVKPWLSGQGAECHRDLLRTCRHFEIPINVPFSKLPAKWQRFVIEGEPDYGKDEEHEWPRAWYGVKGYFRWLESKAYKMHVRVLLSRYRAYTTCPTCAGARLQPEALQYRLSLDGSDSPITLAQFYALPVRNERALIETLAKRFKLAANDAVSLALSEVRSRLGYLDEVGLGYLTLDRPTRSLSGGETERVNLTTCLGTRLVNTLFVLDEPSVGLHPRDTERLVRILEYLRNAGNTVVVVEHEPTVMRSADQIVDLGPGHGAAGGHIVFQGTFQQLLQSTDSLTGQYLSGAKQIEIPRRRPVRLRVKTNATPDRYALNDALNSLESNSTPSLKLTHASRHNLQDVNVDVPLGRFVCVTGVSGSGKTTLIREVLLPALENKLKAQSSNGLSTKASDRFEGNSSDKGPGREPDDEKSESSGKDSDALLTGHEWIHRAVLVDQSILGKTPRSNPAVYIGAFDYIRDLFARSPDAKQRGLNASAFSFNSAQGQCERCRGAGFEKIEMQFLSDVFIRCPDCDGRRYRKHILEIKIESRPASRVDTANSTLSWSIADMLDATVDEAIEFLTGVEQVRSAGDALEALRLLQEVGLGYLRLGQPINTLSGGESQRLKLVRHLADAAVESHSANVHRLNDRILPSDSRSPASDVQPTLFLFDEPTTGLHFEDVRILIKVFQRLVNAGHSVVVIEHNLDLIKSADWLIDLGPDAGDEGGHIVAQGTPEQVANCNASHTGRALKPVLAHSQPSRLLQTKSK